MRPRFMGLDYSTQQLKAVFVDENGNLVHKEKINFDQDLPEFGTKKGVITAGPSVFVPTLLWVEATDILLRRLQMKEIDLNNIAAISGCAQQHGSVYWKDNPFEVMLIGNNVRTLREICDRSFSVEYSPIWMDASACTEADYIQSQFGGSVEFAKRVGTRLFSRFAGPEIRRISEKYSSNYNETKKVNLVSNFAATLWTGSFVPMDFSDACGTGLFSLHSRSLDGEVCEVTAPKLTEKLDHPVSSDQVVGTINPCLVRWYKFPASCKVVAFTGDNPSCVAGLQLERGEVCLSLGTSDTLFVRHEHLPEQNEKTLGAFIMTDPIEPDGYISLICFRNGATVRDRMCQELAGGNWERFSEMLRSTPPGNNGKLGLYFDLPEIQPENLCGRFLVDSNEQPVGSSFGDPNSMFKDPATNIRALIESQLLRNRIFLSCLGTNTDSINKIIVTGGGSLNQAILDVIAGVFGADVYTVDNPDSAALGAAFRAKHALAVEKSVQMSTGSYPQLSSIITHPTQRILAAKCPDENTVQQYSKLEGRLIGLLHRAESSFKARSDKTSF
ncbi:unnamed protein product [Calicophoron daubneyi]|uniref:Xylulose kinase n=1 Tax=Calicophoron daubneyi TaxID=300641 RepID=A0AAV2THM5_CALDB